MKPFSICIIAKNEEKNIRRCLDSVMNFDCEIVVVDTGSTDQTKNIALEYTNRVYDFTWINDFSAARNFSLSKASYDWVLILDCDEWVQSATPEEFMDYAKEYPFYIGRLTRKNLSYADSERGVYTDPVERFFNQRYFHYEGSIHEQVMPLTKKVPMLFDIPLTVLHSGYIGTKEENEEKRNRNTTLLLKELAQFPDDPYLYFQLGQEYYCKGDYETAAQYYSKVFTYDLEPSLEYLRLAIQAYGNCLVSLDRIDEALQFEQLYPTFGDTPDFIFLMGRIYYVSGQYLKAMTEFIKATTMDNAHADGTNSYLCWYYMGLIYEQLGDFDSARNYYKKCGDFEPSVKRMEMLP